MDRQFARLQVTLTLYRSGADVEVGRRRAFAFRGDVVVQSEQQLLMETTVPAASQY